MSRRGKPPAEVGIRELQRRQHRLRTSIGAQIRELRGETGVSQRALANAAGINCGHLSRIERGLVAASLDVLAAISASLGADLGLRLFPTASPRIRDHLQAPIVDAIIRRLGPSWGAFPELPVPAARGVIDLVLRARGGGVAVACEVHSQLRSIDLIQRRLAEKTLALAQIDRFGPTTSSLLAVRSTARNREIVRVHQATLLASLPARSVDVMAALSGTGEWPGPGLLWVRLERGVAQLLDRPPRGVHLGR